MGHSSKKKKRSGGGRGRASSKDSSCAALVDENLLADELTALTSIFQDDFKIISEPPHACFSIKLRPYSSDMGFDDLYVSASLLVRCLPGYPFKCPKLQITPERGLSKEDADRLLVLLLDQAKVNAQEGRVMIFNLVEAAQEFLSEIAPLGESHESIPYVSSSMKSEEATSQFDKHCYSDRSSVYSLVDLYSDLCGNDVTFSHVKKAMNGNSGKIFKLEVRQANLNNNIYLDSHTSANPEIPVRDDSLLQNRKYEAINLIKHGDSPSASAKLNVVAEEVDNDTTSSSPKASSIPVFPDTLQNINDRTKHEDGNLKEQVTANDSFGLDDSCSSSSSYVSVTSDNDSRSRGKDLLLIHLLRIACSSKGSLTNVLPEISLELSKIGVLSEWARDLVAAPSSEFTEAFNNTFGRHISSSRFSEFWRMDSSSSKSTSRYLSDFEEVRSLGRGAFGHVALCRNKLDGRQYALKKIRLKDKNLHVNEKILREVATLSRLQHQHVVRYYQAWLETEYGNNNFDSAAGSRITESFSYSYLGASSGDFSVESRNESTYLYIQMEYCPRTLREDFDSYSSSSDKDYTWHLFRQIVEGLAHIHSQGIIHRDLTPSNIFFDVRNEIKIGDFGLAKFLQLEQVDHDQHFPEETTGMLTDGTGQVGTYFYTAPEVEMSWPQINEKVDMYSLGVIFFELWHPFSTTMERHIVLSDLKQKSLVPPYWAAKFPREATLLQRLISLSPSDRPSATELLQHELPPRLEDEWLNDILRTIESSEDTYVYDRVVSTIFDEGRLISKYHHKQDGCTSMNGDEHSIFMPHTQFGTGFQDIVIAVSKEIFRQHCAKRFEISPLRILDNSSSFNRKSIKLLTQGGNMLELCHEFRSPFINWVVMNQKLFCKRYEISWVCRRAIGHSTPSRFLQGDFDIIGGALSLTEAEVIKVALDIAMHFFPSNAMQIHLNHSQILESIWSWVGIPHELRQNVAELISIIGSSYPQSSHRKLSWNFIRRQLLQDLNVSEALVNRLQLADLRFCGPADQALARLRGALSPDKSTLQALEDMSALLRYLRSWNIEQNISIDVLMPPTETYYQSLFFQIYLKESGSRSYEATLLAIGGRYDRLIQQTWESEYRSIAPGAVGVSIALEKILLLSSVEIMPSRSEPNNHVLVCSRGGGGLLQERMELVAEFWEANIKAEFLPQKDPSFKEQYEYASENDIKCLVIITEAGLSQGSLVKVRHLEFKKEKEVKREEIVRFLTESISTQFRNLTFWT